MRIIALAVLLLIAWTRGASAQDPPASVPAGGLIRGGALAHIPEPVILTWGDRIQTWLLTGAEPKTWVDDAHTGAGGCVDDVDGDGRDDLMVMSAQGESVFVYRPYPYTRSAVIESKTEFQDCLPWNWFGQRGVLFAHRFTQYRLSAYPKDALRQPWPQTEVYSIYTPSKQGGLLPYDVNGDGQTDLVLGNYWMQNPGSPELYWKLYAMNVWHEKPESALAHLALWQRPGDAQPGVVWASTEEDPAHLAWLERPPRITDQWIAHALAPVPKHPRALLVHSVGLFVGSDEGVWLYRWNPDGSIRQTRYLSGFAVLNLVELHDQIWAICSDRVRLIYPLK